MADGGEAGGRLTARAGQTVAAVDGLAGGPCLAAAGELAPAGAGDDADPQTGAAPLPQDLERWLDAQERRVLVRALDETGFNRTAAAALLGLNLRQMRYRMSRLGITEPGSGDAGDGNA